MSRPCPKRVSAHFLLILVIVTGVLFGNPGGESPSASSAPANPDLTSFGRPNLRVFTDRDGLPQNAITSVVFDREGYLWVGTKDGAARYDGRTWTVVNLPPKAGSNAITAIVAASDSSMWFGTGHAGVARLKDGEWSHYRGEEGVLGLEVSCLLERISVNGEAAIYAGTDKGLARFENGRWVRETAAPRAMEQAVTCMLETVSADGGRTLWVGTLLDGVARLRDGVWTVFDQSTGFSVKGITSLLETTAIDGQPLLVAGTFDDDLLIFDGDTWTRASDRIPAVGRGGIYCLLQSRSPDGSTALWVGTSGGLARFERGQWRMIDENRGMPPAPIWHLARIDADSGTATIFAGTAGFGLVQLQLERWTAFDTKAGLLSNSIYSLLVTQEDDGSDVLWVGTNTTGLSRLHRGVWTHHNGPAGFNDAGVWSLLDTTDPDGERVVWAGTHNGLMRLKNGQWTVYKAAEGVSPPINTMFRTKAADGSDALWIGTNAGVLRFENGRAVSPGPGLEVPEPRVKSLCETVGPDGTRTLWVGTVKGLVRFERGVSRYYDRESGLPGDGVTSLREYRSERGRELWIGTPVGVAVLDLDSPDEKWTYLSTATVPTLPNNMIYRIEEDVRRRLYLFTNKGIARLSPRTSTPDDPSRFDVYTFTLQDGLPSNECNTGASTVDARGRIWAGTIGGVAAFDPGREIGDVRPISLVIERAFLPALDRPLVSGASLAYDENNVLFEFSLLSYFREIDTQYRVQLIGYDDEPSEWSPEFKRNYISLPPGEYRFRVWGRDAFGNVAGPVEIPFTIRPAPWLTWWAILLYVVAGGCLVFAAFRFRVRSLRRSNEQLEAGIAERTTQLAHTVEDLRESEQRALDANRAKSTFLANMSHELRTPLNAILGFAQLIDRDPGLSPAHRESLRFILHSGEHLLGLINDVLSIAKIEAGRIELVEQNFDFVELLETVREMIRLRAEQKGLSLVLEFDPNLPVVVYGDVGKLRQVFVNLLGNAVKFTDAGGVTLRVRWEDLEDDEGRYGRATFEVIDTGCGMSEHDIGRLFEAFVQTESGKRLQEGTGLGLVISRSIVRLMGGDIRVASTVGAGTTFTFDVILRITSHVDRRTGRVRRNITGVAPDDPRWRILVADDTMENRLLLTRILKMTGFDVREAANGAEAVDLWRSWHPDLIWMDMRMPVMDGREAARRIRELEAAGERPSGDWHVDRTKILALTASALEHERDTFFEAGCDDYVPKPFQISTIFLKMADHLGVRYVYEEEKPAEPDVRGERLTAGRLIALAPAVAEALRRALTIGDTEAAMQIIERVRESDAALADDLAASVRSFRFEEVLDALDSTEN